MRKWLLAASILLCLSLLECGGGSSSGSGGNNPPPPPPALTVTTTSPLTAGTQNLGYLSPLSAAHGTPCSGANPYTWTLSSGSLPAGLSIAGQSITGTPTAAGTSSFAVKVTDCASNSAVSGTLSLTVDPPAAPTQGSTATVDFSTTHQTIRGFGGSDAWFSVLPTAAINALFGTGSGQIGLSMLRSRIDPSSTTAGAQWSAELTNAQHAIAAGSNVIVFATPWTPPAVWKSNNNVDNGGSLNTGNYLDYANYLESFVTYMANGQPPVSLYAISMQNEPDFTATYESCIWSPQQMDTWVAQLPAGLLTTKLIMPESLSFNQSYSDPALNDAAADANISIIAGHLYGSAPAPYPLAVQKGKELWMTEHYLNPVTTQPPIFDALNAAVEIHNSLTIAEYNAYVWWWVQDLPSQNSFIGLIDSNNNVKPQGAAMAQFSRFVRPGYVRADATNSTANVYVSAYEGGGHFVIVAINTNSSAVDQPFTISGQSITSLTPYQTTSTTMVAAQTAVSVSANQFTYTLPPQSITTFVQ